ncbi:MAG: SGNH/GDSL hydrolase family protein [Candidatus Omnitrophota bacterium]
MKNLSAGNPSKIFWFLDKVFCILFGVLLVLVGLEFFLRLLGFGYNVIHKAPVDTGAKYRIYCVGESTTWGVGASDPVLKGYPHQLEEMLNSKYKGMKIQCLFDQTIGQNTSEILAKFPQHIKKYRPQLVIFLMGVNNWWNMDRSNILLFNKNQWVSQLTLKALIFLDKFRVWKLFKNMAFPLRPSQERWNYFNVQAGRVPEEREERRWNKDPIFDELAEHDIGEMVKICKAEGIKIIMCTYPVAARDLRRVQINVAKKYGLLLVDHYAVFQKLKDRQVYLSTEDYWHPNDAGYAIVAENIYNCILENRLIEPKEKKDPR